jgi:uncharacterized membrane-anchored protein
MVALSVVSTVNEKLIPLHVQITVFSLSIITIGSFRSLSQMVTEMKKSLIDKVPGETSAVETVTNKDALQFPLYAGGMLCFLYALIKFFGKDAVNYVILVYIAVGGGTGMLTYDFKSGNGSASRVVEIAGQRYTLLLPA